MTPDDVTAWLPIVRECGATVVLALALWTLATDRFMTRGRYADMRADRDYWRARAERIEAGEPPSPPPAPE